MCSKIEMLDTVIEITENYEYKKNVLRKADDAFMLAYEKFLKTKENQEETIILNVTENSQIETILEVNISNIDLEDLLIEEIKEETKKNIEIDIKFKRTKKITDNQDIKNLYRAIVKIVHPDKNQNYILAYQKLYLDATEAYENKLLFPLVKIAALLRIDANLSIDSLNLIERELEKLLEEMQMMEFSFCWSWFHAPNSSLQHDMLLMFHQRKMKHS